MCRNMKCSFYELAVSLRIFQTGQMCKISLLQFGEQSTKSTADIQYPCIFFDVLL